MSPNLLLTALKTAYDNREEAEKLFAKIKEWRNSDKQDSDTGTQQLSVEDRLDRLESHTETKDRIDEQQSELIADLASNVADLSASTQALMARTRVLMWLIMISLCTSVAALIAALA